MAMKQLFVYLLLTLPVFGTAQEGTTYVFNENASEKDYSGIKGSPMLFDDWVMGDVITITGRKIDSVYLNYDAYGKEVLINSQGKAVPLDTDTYMSFQIPGEYENEHVDVVPGEKLLFIRGVNNKFPDQYIQVLHNGQLYKLLKDYFVTIGKQTAQIPGKTITTERFKTDKRYYILGPNELKQVKLRKKEILGALPKSNALKSFIEDNKLDLKKEKDVIMLLKEYETSF